ncbi:hypothetical protein C900_02994 [Fulvivirga imtechensis AK7]|uniref:Uncharacterized protein n=1 Tax=Fulvivirga imtechensis AK7 TaxID=1237149 RepID=L8JQQ7_9BACT|nr:hypothetical protein [Fulvivirga imtechensis]ELR71190.1 hypothetical protein C900_02994 [Fulvivirga imtechensis AK7]
MRYETLLSVVYSHQYYRSGKFRGFGILPATGTERLFRSYGIIIRELEAGFTLLFKEENSGESLIRKLRQKLRFTFYIASKDRMFMNYSNIPGDLDGYWLSNLNVNGSDPSLIHQDAFLGERDRIQFVSSPADITRGMTDGSAVDIEDMFGEQIFQGVKEELSESYLKTLLSEHDYLTITVNGQANRYYNKPGVKQLVGVIDIVLDPESPGHSFDAIKGAEYKVAIDTRPTTWRYNLINRDEYKYADFKIYSGKNVVPTTAAEEKKMITGEKAYFIETTTPIPLKERYENALELEMVKIETDRNIKRRISLPVPDINKVKVIREADAYRAYSEMYIYF